MKKYLSLLGSALLGASLLASAAALAVHQGYYIVLSADEGQAMFLEIMGAINGAMQQGYELCKAGF